MWTSKNRARYDCSKLRYPSDLTDDEWGLVEPLNLAGSCRRSAVVSYARSQAAIGNVDEHLKYNA
jgi:hypothetical protein